MEATGEAGQMRVKRKRKQRAILSCNDCRRRKLKCNRELPCNRCINGGVAEKCAYGKEEDPAESDGTDIYSIKRVRRASLSPHPIHNMSTWAAKDLRNVDERTYVPSEKPSNERVIELEERIATLEGLLSSLQDKSERPVQAQSRPGNVILDDGSAVSTGLFKGRDYRTFYYGPTSPITIVAHFPDLRPFMKRVHTGSTLERLRQDQKRLEDRVRVNKLSHRVLSVPELRSLLPDRDTVDKVIKTYFDTFETTFRILHIPTFWAAYEHFWDEPHTPNPDMDAVVLAILACTLCISTHEVTKYDTNGSTFRSKAIVWIKACEAWLRQQSNKHRTLVSLQVRCLRLIAISTTCYKTKEYYQEVQSHLGLMRSWGMHRDPEILGSRCSVFEAEMRRRLWATSTELELQASIDKGIPSIFSTLQSDCAPPRNLNDSDLHPDMKYLPNPQRVTLFTDTSYLHLSFQTFPLRLRLCNLANALQPKYSFQETLQYEQEILKELGRLPAWTEPRSLQARTLLDVQLRQCIVLLHTQRVLTTQIKGKPENRYALLTTLEATGLLIELHAHLIDRANFALCCTRSDYLRAALLICHIAYHASITFNSIIAQTAKATFDSTIEKSLRLLEERSLRPGRGNHQFWFISAASSLVSIQFDPSRTAVYEHQAADKVCRLLYKVLALQDDPAEGTLVREVLLGENPVSADKTAEMGASQGFDFAMPGTSFAGGEAGFDDDVAASGWALDDYWFMDEFPVVGGNEKSDLRFGFEGM